MGKSHLSHHLFAGPYVRVWEFGTLLKGTSSVLWGFSWHLPLLPEHLPNVVRAGVWLLDDEAQLFIFPPKAKVASSLPSLTARPVRGHVLSPVYTGLIPIACAFLIPQWRRTAPKPHYHVLLPLVNLKQHHSHPLISGSIFKCSTNMLTFYKKGCLQLDIITRWMLYKQFKVINPGEARTLKYDKVEGRRGLPQGVSTIVHKGSGFMLLYKNMSIILLKKRPTAQRGDSNRLGRGL